MNKHLHLNVPEMEKNMNNYKLYMTVKTYSSVKDDTQVSYVTAVREC